MSQLPAAAFRFLRRLPPVRLVVAVLMLLSVGSLWLTLNTRTIDSPGLADAEVIDFSPSLPLPSAQPAVKPIERRVKNGETLGKVLGELGLASGEANAAVDAMRAYVDPRRIRSGDVLLASYSPAKTLAGLEFKVPGKGTVALAKLETGWRTSWTPVVRDVVPEVVSGRLQGSLEDAIEAAGADGILAYELADVLQWDLDFSRDLRVGDEFQIFFEETYLDGKYDSIAGIVAVRYENRGKVIRAYRYGDAGGYYDSEGRPLKKMFLRSPLRFSRVTSKFSHRRFHPVLHTFRPHYGVDYGAPTGTPAMVTANGTVTFAGWDRGGGKTVKVRHAGGYVTAYLHLSRFAEGIRPGASVKQGDVVGFVGATGLATAPHLDYRVSLNGNWIDPLSLTTLPARPLSGAELVHFKQWRQALDLSLTSGKPQRPEQDGQLATAESIARETTSARR